MPLSLRAATPRSAVATLALALASASLGALAVTGAAPAAAAPAPSAGAPTLSTNSYPVPSGAKIVATSGSDSTGDGSSSRPYGSVQKAVDSAASGSTIVIRGGTYYEDVRLPSGKRLTIQPHPGEEVWFDGSTAATGWVADGPRWRRDGWTTFFDTRDYTGVMVDPKSPMAAHPDQIFINGVALKQVSSASAVTAGTFYVDRTNKRLWIGSSPSGKEVRVSTKTEALYVNRGHGSVIRGLGFRRYATPTARMGAVKGYGDRIVVENCVFVDNALAGLSLNGRDITVSTSTFSRNGQLGIQADTTDNLRLVRNRVERNNAEGFMFNQAAGGIKITTARPVSVTGNVVSSNVGNGLWIDQTVKYAKVTGNTFTANTRHGTMFELSGGLVFAGNRATGNLEAGVKILEAGNAKIYHNTFVDNRIGIDLMDGDRVSALAPTSSDQDRRYTTPDPYITWEVENVVIRGNVVEAAPGARQMIGYDDARKKYGPAVRNITANYDVFWRPSSTASSYFAAWGMWPTGMQAPRDLASYKRLGQESSGTGKDGGTTNPYIDAAGMPTSSTPYSSALPDDVADALGVTRGSTYRAGIVRPTP